MTKNTNTKSTDAFIPHRFTLIIAKMMTITMSKDTYEIRGSESNTVIFVDEMTQLRTYYVNWKLVLNIDLGDY